MAGEPGVHGWISLEEARGIPGGKVVAVGTFDGVHLGHQAVVQALLARVREVPKLTPAVVSFHPHPVSVLDPARAPRLLSLPHERAQALVTLGVPLRILVPFVPALASLSAPEFAAHVLHEQLGAVEVVVGFNFRFGRGGEGSGRALEDAGLRTHVIPPVYVGREVVSSTRIRQLLAAGKVEEAQVLLGRPYRVGGTVVAGDGRGRTLGFPTANVRTGDEKLLPREGVYAAWARLADGKVLPAVVSLGRRPTFAGKDVRLEVHLIDWQGDLYGQEVDVWLVRYLRPEERFATPEALVAQMRADRDQALGACGREVPSSLW